MKFILFINGTLTARYTHEIHGTPTLKVADPKWIRPVIDLNLAPGQSFEHNGELITNKSNEVAIFKGVPDQSAVPNLIEITNPDCKIPIDAILVTDKLFNKTINEQDGIWTLDKGEIVKKPIPAPTLSESKLTKKAEITQAFSASMSQVVGNTPSYEIDSWGKQEAEARSFTNAATALNPTPLIDNLASARGISKALLASKIIQKADLYSSYSGQLIGKRQGLEDAIDAATTKTAVAAISW